MKLGDFTQALSMPGRVQIAEDLMQAGIIKTPQEYFKILNMRNQIMFYVCSVNYITSLGYFI